MKSCNQIFVNSRAWRKCKTLEVMAVVFVSPPTESVGKAVDDAGHQWGAQVHACAGMPDENCWSKRSDHLQFDEAVTSSAIET